VSVTAVVLKVAPSTVEIRAALLAENQKHVASLAVDDVLNCAGPIRSPGHAADAQFWLLEHGCEPGTSGNAAGSIVKGCEWKLVGYRMSARVSRHRNRVGI
jgi:hypothetical protein